MVKWCHLWPQEIWAKTDMLWLTNWPLGDLDAIIKMSFSLFLYWLASSDLTIMSSNECHRTLQMISQHWFRIWPGAIRQQDKDQCWPSSMSPYVGTWPQGVNSFWPSDTSWHQTSWSTLVQATAGHLLLVLGTNHYRNQCYLIGPFGTTFSEILLAT